MEERIARGTCCNRPTSKALVVAVIALFYVIVGAMYIRPHNYDLTAFICVGSVWNIQEIAPLPLEIFSEHGYDGQFYYAMALGPWNTKVLRQYTDMPAYRYQRILIPLMGRALAWGNPRVVHVAMALAGLALVLGATYIFMGWFSFRNLNGYWALLFPLFPGTIHSLLRLTPDAPAAALLIIGSYLVVRSRIGWSALVFALAILIKETSVLVPCGLLFHFAWRREWRSVFLLSASVVTFGIWMLVVRCMFGNFPFVEGGGNIGAPIIGMLDGIARNRTMLTGRTMFIKIGVFNLLMLAQYALLAGLAIIYTARRKTTAFTPALLLFVVLAALLSDGTWRYEWSITRMIMPVSLFFLIHVLEAGMTRADRVAIFISLPMMLFMLDWMGLHF